MALAILPAAGYVLVAQSTGEASSCPGGTLADYVSNFGENKSSCTLGGGTLSDLTFSNFKFVTVGVSAGSVRVTPVTTGDPGFIFNGLWNQGSGSSLFFDVSSTSGSPLIKDASLTSVFTTTGPGLTGADLSYDWGCSWVAVRDHTCTPGPESNTLEANSINNTPDSNSKSFTPVATLGVDTVDFDARGGTVTQVTARFSTESIAVPEPSIIVLLGTGVLGLVFKSGMLRRRAVA